MLTKDLLFELFFLGIYLYFCGLLGCFIIFCYILLYFGFSLFYLLKSTSHCIFDKHIPLISFYELVV